MNPYEKVKFIILHLYYKEKMSVPEFINNAPSSFKAVKYEKIWWLKNVSAECGAQLYVLDNYTTGYFPVKNQNKKNGNYGRLSQ